MSGKLDIIVSIVRSEKTRLIVNTQVSVYNFLHHQLIKEGSMNALNFTWFSNNDKRSYTNNENEGRFEDLSSEFAMFSFHINYMGITLSMLVSYVSSTSA